MAPLLKENMTSPDPPGLPAPPEDESFGETQWAVLLALADAVVPSIVAESSVTDVRAHKGIPDAEYLKIILAGTRNVVEAGGDESLLRAYLDDRPSKHPDFLTGCRLTIASLPKAEKARLSLVLYVLSTRLGSLLATGHITPVHRQPVHVREAVLKSWARSWLVPPRILCKAVTQLAQTTWSATSPLLGQATGYPEVPPDWKPVATFDFSFLQLPAGPGRATIETDVVIVGSGCGGAVCAKVLAEAGHRVLVVDKGYHFPPVQLPMPQRAGMHHLFENGGMVQSADASVSIVAGSCWGGGGTVNWGVSLQTQDLVRREWADAHGLPLFASPEFQACLDRVCAVMGAAPPPAVSRRGRDLLGGARRLGWDAAALPLNTGGREHPDGHCHLGCWSGGKLGTTVTWLPAAGSAGAKFVEGFHVDRVVFDESSGEKVATGVVGRWTSRDGGGGVAGPAEERTTREVLVKAKKVIISSGSLWSPVILQKSGLKNKHIGRNLHVHPVNFVGAYYDEEIRPWEEPVMTSICTGFEDMDGHGHGAKLEDVCMVPYLIFGLMPWRSGLDTKLAALRYRHMAVSGSLTRDRGTGSVGVDPASGRHLVRYTPSATDAAHMLEGVLALAGIFHATGAAEIRAFLPGVEPWVRAAAGGDGGADGFEAWLARLRAAGNRGPGVITASAHQMGSCRMGRDPAAGAVDARGRAWEARGLYVADASVFPSASGVNPMVTNMAIADWIARGVAEELKAEGAARR